MRASRIIGWTVANIVFGCAWITVGRLVLHWSDWDIAWWAGAFASAGAMFSVRRS